MLRVALARDFTEKSQAWHLVHRQYTKSSLAQPNLSGMLYSALDLLPTSITAVALESSTLVGTMSAVVSPIGALPSGEKFEEDLKEFGVDGRVICEFTKLACLSKAEVSTEQVSLSLMAYLLAWCAVSGVDDAICVTHPRHALAWCRVFGWSPISAVKGVSHVNNAPGVLLHIDIRALAAGMRISTRGRKLFDLMRKEITESRHGYRATGSELAMLLLQRPTVLGESTEPQRSLLTRYYPWATYFVENFVRTISEPWRPFLVKSENKPHREQGYSYLSWLPDGVGVDRENAGGLKFLLVESDPVTQRYTSTLLKRSEHYCQVVESFERAMQELAGHFFDIVLLGSFAQDSNVVEFCDAVRLLDGQRRTHTPIIETTPSGMQKTSHSLVKGWSFEQSTISVIVGALEHLGEPGTKRDYQHYAQLLRHTVTQPIPTQEMQAEELRMRA